MAQQGQAAGYYDDRNTYQEYQATQGPPPPQEYQSPPPPQQNYGQPYNAPQQGYEPKYGGQQPPTYGEAFNPPQHPNQDFKETFKIQKPKWNDLWAGLLVRTWDSPNPSHTC